MMLPDPTLSGELTPQSLPNRLVHSIRMEELEQHYT